MASMRLDHRLLAYIKTNNLGYNAINSRSLHDIGFKQGSIVECDSLSIELCKEIEQHRPLISQRSKPIAPKDSKNKLIVLTQECDIARGKQIELIFAKPLADDKVYVGKTKTRNLECLHLPHDGKYLELKSSLISTVPCAVLLNDTKFSPTGRLSKDGRNLIKNWRVQTYTRDPLPDAFDTFFFRNYVHTKDNQFNDLLTSHAGDVADVYVYIHPDKAQADLYFVSFTILLASDVNQVSFNEIESKSKLMLAEINNLDGIQVLQIDRSGFSSEYAPTTDMLVARPEDFTMLDVMSMEKLRLHSYCGPDDWNDD